MEHTKQLVQELKKTAIEKKAPIWKRIAVELEKPARNKRVVNLYKLEKYCNDGETIIVPGKVLGTGVLTKKLNVVAFQYSNDALEKINKVGTAVTIKDYLKKNTASKGVRIIG